MDADAILAKPPPDKEFRRLSPTAKKECAELAVELALDAIDAERRQPDGWESGWLSITIQSIMAGFYGAAIRFVRMALTPTERRIEVLSPDSEGVERTITEHRNALAEARLSEVKDRDV